MNSKRLTPPLRADATPQHPFVIFALLATPRSPDCLVHEIVEERPAMLSGLPAGYAIEVVQSAGLFELVKDIVNRHSRDELLTPEAVQ